MRTHGTSIDLRHELRSEFDVQTKSVWREHPHLSENAKKLLEKFKSPKWERYEQLIYMIESGNASGSEDESIEVYDMVSDLFGEVLDLFDMVSRRDERLAELDNAVEAVIEDAVGALAQKLYEDSTDNHPTIHSNRFPAWSELPAEAQQVWRVKAQGELADA